jgi:cytochrome c553
MKNILFAIISLTIIITALAATLPNNTVSAKFKNLKVLPKNISEAALDKIMEDFNVALGVNCNYCHSKNETTQHLKFESDSKPEKIAARRMMTMTNDINIKNFAATKDKYDTYAVTCITCHRQKAYPSLDSLKSKL